MPVRSVAEAFREHCRTIAPLGSKAGGVTFVLARGMVHYKTAASGQSAATEFAFSMAPHRRYL